MSVYPAAAKNFFYDSSISMSTDITTVIDRPISLLGFNLNWDSPKRSLSSTDGFSIRVYDGDVEKIRVLDIYGFSVLACNIYSFSFPLSGIRIQNSLGANIQLNPGSTDPGITITGLSVLYKD